MRYIIITCAIIMGLTSCYKQDPYWLDENIKEGGTYYPLIQDFRIAPTDTSITNFELGQQVTLEVQFWSRDEVSQIAYYKVEAAGDVELGIQEYNPTFDPESEAFLQYITYTLPTETSDSTFTFKAIVQTVHNLTREREATISIE